MSDIVLDASAVLALINAEHGADSVANVLRNAAISTVNLSEVVGKLSEGGLSLEAIRQIVSKLSIKTIPFDTDQAYIAGSLRTVTRLAGLSLADRACLALAMHLGVPAMTMDRAWRGLKLDVNVQVVR